jgi:two-component system response regulator RegA
MDPLSPTLLVVDDDTVFRDRLARALAARGYAVRAAGDVTSALMLAREESPERAVVDLRMPGGSGLDLVAGLREIDPTTRVVVLTGYGSIATAVEALRRGACHYLQKPVDADQILAAFEPGPEGEPGATMAAETTPSQARFEWEHMQRVLHDAGGNISEAARRLGLHRRSLQRKLFKNPPPV